MRSENVFEDITTKTSSSDWKILSKLTEPLYGFWPSIHCEFTGQRYPLEMEAPGLRFGSSHGSGNKVDAFRYPPQNFSGLFQVLVELFGSVQTHVRRKLDLKL
jgi:hypothetical protein